MLNGVVAIKSTDIWVSDRLAVIYYPAAVFSLYSQTFREKTKKVTSNKEHFTSLTKDHCSIRVRVPRFRLPDNEHSNSILCHPIVGNHNSLPLIPSSTCHNFYVHISLWWPCRLAVRQKHKIIFYTLVRRSIVEMLGLSFVCVASNYIVFKKNSFM